MIVAAPEARRRLWPWILSAVLLLGLLAVLFQFNPSHNSFYPLCVFHRITGLQCPGCGGLRAAHHLLRGELWMAFRFNPLAVLALPVAGWFGVRRWRNGVSAKRFSERAAARWALGLFAVVMLFWILRNLPLDIFKLPES